MCPPEIAELQKNQICNATVVIEFASLSDREGDIVGRLEIKTGSGGGVPVEIKPSLCELLKPPPSSVKVQDFDESMQRMQGPFQRVELSFSTQLDLQGISRAIGKHTGLDPIGEEDTTSGLRFMAFLPSSNQPVYVVVNGPKASGGIGKLLVCCDHAVAINSIAGLLKRTLNA